MHDMAVTFDGELLGNLHSACLGNLAYVVATEIYEHKVLSDFLGIC